MRPEPRIQQRLRAKTSDSETAILSIGDIGKKVIDSAGGDKSRFLPGRVGAAGDALSLIHI